MAHTQVPDLRSWSLVAVAAFTVGGLIGVAPPANAAACTPTETTVDGQEVYTFSTVGTCTWTVPTDAGFVRLLIVAGGGAAGKEGTGQGGGGGGAGGAIQKASYSVVPGASVTITVGAGATVLSEDGDDSVFAALTAVGGGGGGEGFGTGSALDGRPGGSGGGAAATGGGTGGASQVDQGNDGGDSSPSGGCARFGAGGGGAGGPGDDGGATKTSGGAGIQDDISGTSVLYAPGGAGGKTCGFAGNAAATAIGAGGNATTTDNNSSGVNGIVIVRVVAGADSGSSESSGEPSAVMEPESLELQTPDGVTCSSKSLGGSLGSWITLPGSDDCSVTDEPDKKVLGWATIEDFPVGIAQRQVNNDWGAYESFDDDGQMTAVFIPAGGTTFLSDSNALYPVIGE